MAAEHPWMIEARRFLGVKEITGSAHEAKIVKFFADAGHPDIRSDEVAWCAAFAGAMLEAVGIRSTRSLTARSYLKWGRAIDKPIPGCIVVFKRGNSTWQGHVAFYEKDGGNYIWVLGGNQSNAVTIQKYAKSNVLGYRMPDAAAVPVLTKRPVAPTPISQMPPLKTVPAPFDPILPPQMPAGGSAGFPESETAGPEKEGSGGRVGLWLAGLFAVAVTGGAVWYWNPLGLW